MRVEFIVVWYPALSSTAVFCFLIPVADSGEMGRWWLCDEEVCVWVCVWVCMCVCVCVWVRDKELNVSGLCRLWLARSCSFWDGQQVSALCALWKSHSVDEADYTGWTGVFIFFEKKISIWDCYCDLWKSPVFLQPWIRYFISETSLRGSVKRSVKSRPLSLLIHGLNAYFS